MSSVVPGPDDAAAARTSPLGAVLDPEVLRALVDGDEAFLRELAAEFAKSAARAGHELTVALDDRDLPRIAQVAHRFKSAAAQVGAHAAAERSAALERLGRSATDDPEVALGEARRLITALLPVLTALEDALRRLAVAPVEADPAGPRHIP